MQQISSESVTEGHPDKLCDQISDSLLDAILTQDPDARVAIETLATTDRIVVAGEVTTTAKVDITAVVRETVNTVGYVDATHGFDGNSCQIDVHLHEQSRDIAQGVDTGKGFHLAQGAGDQGLMYGYACSETPEYMPLPISLAHQLTSQLAQVRKQGILDRLRPDGKAQVTVEYQNKKPVRVDTIVLSTQHAPDISHQEITTQILQEVISPVAGGWIDDNTIIHINPTGSFVIGGPHGDAGLTGRKIIVDTYGGIGRHGGGAFSGKDPSKVDRSAAYMARYLAKNIVASGIAEQCELQLSYAIGVAEPVSLFLDCGGTEKIDLSVVTKYIREQFDLTPQGTIKKLDLLKPIYRQTASYGHFGRPQFSREQTDSAELFAKLLG